MAGPDARVVQKPIHGDKGFSSPCLTDGKKTGLWKTSFQAKRDENGMTDNVAMRESSFRNDQKGKCNGKENILTAAA
jgi:hypothetical protein